MSNEYIVINKTELLKRIEELEKYLEDEPNPFLNTSYQSEMDTLNRILSKSTPLMPEIEKAFDEGKGVGIISYNRMGHTIDKELYNERKQHYISNLKLDI